MANVIKHKRGSGSDPVANDLVVGEVAIRTDVGKLFTKMDNGSVAEIAGGGSDIAINTLSSSSGTGGGSATFNGSAFRFTLSAPPSVSAQQLLVSINGVIQKPVAGTGQPSEGFSVDGTDIILGDAPATGSDFFILTFKSLGVSEPADNSVTSAKIVDGTIVNADINASAAIAGTKIDPDFGSQGITTTGVISMGNGLTLTGTNPFIDIIDSNNNSDFTIKNDNGTFEIEDKTNSNAVRLAINSSGNVGIGTTTIGNKLQVHEASSNASFAGFSNDTTGSSSTDGLIVGVDSDENGVLYHYENKAIRFATNNSERMRITPNGNVLIGTSDNSLGGKFVVDTDISIIRSSSSPTLNFFLGSASSPTKTYRFLINDAENDRFELRDNNTARVTLDGSGNVGIGTTSPNQELEVNGNIGINANLTHNGDTDTRLSFSAANQVDIVCGGTTIGSFTTNGISTGNNKRIDILDGSGHRSGVIDNSDSGANSLRISADPDNSGSNTAMTFFIDASEKMRIKSDGSVGIGTSSPDQTLHVHKGSAGSVSSSTSSVLTLESDATAVLQFLTPSASAAQLRFGDPSDNGAGFIQYNHSINALQIGTNGPEKMRLDASGRLGIGTTSPSSLLELRQSSASHQIVSINRANSDTAALFLGNDSSQNALISANNSNLIFGKDFSSTFTEHMRIDSSGHILFTGSSSQKVAFGTPDNTKYAGFGRHDGAAQDVGLNFYTTTNAGTTFVNHFRIDHNGELFGTDTDGISSISDSRVKTDITDYTYDLAIFKQFTPKQFNWKNPEYHGEKTNVKGFLAQDLEAIDRQWVGFSFIEKDHPDYDLVDKSKNGQDEDVGVAKTSKFGGKDAMYISVINQLIARVEALEAK